MVFPAASGICSDDLNHLDLTTNTDVMPPFMSRVRWHQILSRATELGVSHTHEHLPQAACLRLGGQGGNCPSPIMSNTIRFACYRLIPGLAHMYLLFMKRPVAVSVPIGCLSTGNDLVQPPKGPRHVLATVVAAAHRAGWASRDTPPAKRQASRLQSDQTEGWCDNVS